MKKILKKIQRRPFLGSLLFIVFGILLIAIADVKVGIIGMGEFDVRLGIMLIVIGIILLAISSKK